MTALLAIAMSAVASEGPAPALPVLAPTQTEVQAAILTEELLARYEYSVEYRAAPLASGISEKVFDHYLKMLDPDKLYFLQSDIASFTPGRSTVLDKLQSGNLQLPFDIFNVYIQRITERLTFANQLLKERFNFNQQESFQAKRDAEPWASTEDMLHDNWRKRVKNDWLRLKLAGENDTSIRQTLTKRYANFLVLARQSKSEDVFQLFMEAYATTIDPHTDYFGLRAAQEFDAEMRLSKVGVGIILEQAGEYMVITELVPGGPAALSNKLSVGDRLVGIADGAHGPFTDVVGARIDDASSLAQGASGSTVRLRVMRSTPDGTGKLKTVTLVRRKVSFDEDAAKMRILKITDGAVPRTVAIISLPIFYEDFEARSRGDQNFKSATRDVARLLSEAKSANVDCVLLDLRNNGGGSLDEAIRLTGLFIGSGPVLQERDAWGEVKLLNADGTDIAWSGVLGVLINHGSASASEIFAAAIQDYGRGIIIGEKSFGKGTVQIVANLDEIAGNERPEFGELKMTIAQFFRISGGSTQLRGVTPDLALPASFDAGLSGESDFDNALPWTEIPPATYVRRGDVAASLTELQRRHALRIANNKDFQYLQEDVAENLAERDKLLISLNQADRSKERDVLEAKLKSRKELSAGDVESMPQPRQDNGLDEGEDSVANVLAAEKAKSTAKDIELTEAASVLGDEVELLLGQSGHSPAPPSHD
jgi:carboxyl-terminal processing protease